MSTCCSNYCNKRNPSYVLIQCLKCKDNHHAECLQSSLELPNAVNFGKEKMKYPGMAYICKKCRDEPENSDASNKILSKITEKFEELKNELCKTKSTNVPPVTWATMVKKYSEEVKSEVMVESKDPNITSIELKKTVLEKVKDEDFGEIKVFPTRDNKGLKILTDGDEKKHKLYVALNADMPNCHVSEYYFKKSPRIKILRVESKNIEKEIDDIYDEIAEQVYKASLIDGTPIPSVNYWVEHVATLKVKGKHGEIPNVYNIVASIDSRAYKILMRMQKVRIKSQQYDVVDGTYIPRCYKCFGYFHKAEDCTLKYQTCRNCGRKGHKHVDCLNQKRCNNCIAANKNLNERYDVNHGVTDLSCPYFMNLLKKFVRTIDYGLDD